MRVSISTIKGLCKKRGITITKLLRQAKVSRNAFYSLAREETILPRSLRLIADSLKIQPMDMLTEDHPELEAMKKLLAEVDTIVSNHRGLSRDRVRHTLLLLQEEPITRLRRALIRGRKINIRQT